MLFLFSNEFCTEVNLLPEMDIPAHMVPPNPDDSDSSYGFLYPFQCSLLKRSLEVLPSHIHPSYPYGNPTNIKHPAARPRVPYDPTSRALFEDMGYAGGGVNGTLRWKDLALDILLPVDKEREEAEKAAHARKMASGTTANHYQPASQPPETAAEEGDADDENENDENDDDEIPDEREAETSYEDDEE